MRSKKRTKDQSEKPDPTSAPRPQQMSPREHHTSSLLTLPVELRMEIYKHAIQHEHKGSGLLRLHSGQNPRHGTRTSKRLRDLDKMKWGHALLFVCKEIHVEYAAEACKQLPIGFIYNPQLDWGLQWCLSNIMAASLKSCSICIEDAYALEEAAVVQAVNIPSYLPEEMTRTAEKCRTSLPTSDTLAIVRGFVQRMVKLERLDLFYEDNPRRGDYYAYRPYVYDGYEQDADADFDLDLSAFNEVQENEDILPFLLSAFSDALKASTSLRYFRVGICLSLFDSTFLEVAFKREDAGDPWVQERMVLQG